ncbi:hypothetical protein COLO4_32792 [Corchorus olitorius]|uniref:Uncharacterized protein n=1 Tax=Corchorus olitorius TaxID=93759 RepID=A0A1R3GXX8_9ROSI|nr:hypothetical protein COLO4_32792 [Corchorus olitorius]
MELPLLCPFVNCVLAQVKFPLYFPYFVASVAANVYESVMICLKYNGC